jgi:hypothetical protein
MFADLSDARKGGAKDGGGMEIITGVERRRRWQAEDKSRVLAKAAVEHAVAAGEATAEAGSRLGTKATGEAIAKRVRKVAGPA